MGSRVALMTPPSRFADTSPREARGGMSGRFLIALPRRDLDAAHGAAAMDARGIHVGHVRGRQREAARCHGAHDVGDMDRS